jgi:hypothetical protein
MVLRIGIVIASNAVKVLRKQGKHDFSNLSFSIGLDFDCRTLQRKRINHSHKLYLKNIDSYLNLKNIDSYWMILEIFKNYVKK